MPNISLYINAIDGRLVLETYTTPLYNRSIVDFFDMNNKGESPWQIKKISQLKVNQIKVLH